MNRRRLALSLAVLLLVLAATACWLLGSDAGLRLALAQARASTHGALQWRQATGSLLSPTINGLRYDDGAGTRVTVRKLRLVLGFWPLLAKRVQVRQLVLDEVTVTLPTRTDAATPGSGNRWFKPPLDLWLDRVQATAVQVNQAGQPLFAADRLDLAGRWTQTGLAIDQLTLRAPDGHAELAGRLAVGQGQRGDGHVDFAWTLGGRRYAGRLDAHGSAQQAQFDLALRQPMAARLQVQLVPSRQAHWRATLSLPSFDPGPLLGEAHLKALALQLQGQGDRHHGELSGTLTLNQHPLQLQSLRVGWPRDGTLELAQLRLRWPQTKAQLDASGSLQLQPTLAWRLDARATGLDPGQLFADWPGSLDVAFASHGQRSDHGLDATLELRQLSGQLRGRTLTGSGTLHLSPPQVLDGQLRLASGKSTLRLVARPGRNNDAQLTLATASLGDWLPHAHGRLDGQFTVRGRLPSLAINGHLDGSALAWRQTRAQSLRLIVGLPDSRRLAGKLELSLGDAQLAGLDFARLHLRAEGSEGDHVLALDAHGRQLSAQLALHGARQGNSWRGTLATLTLAPQDLPPWRLQQPSQLTWRGGAGRLAETCLVAGAPQLCLRASRDPSGNIQASYSLRALPLALLLNAAGAGDLPVRVEGELAGDGTLRYSAQGVLTGDASLNSASGSLHWLDHPELPPSSYRQLALHAALGAQRQQLTLHAALDHDGLLDGQLTLSGKHDALDGQLALRLHNLAFLQRYGEVLAKVQGQAVANLRLAGTLAQPAVSGAATLSEFAAEVPAAGLALSQGHFTLTANGSQPLRLDGSVRSGAGTLTLVGELGLASGAASRLRITGERFSAADIPAARLVLSPDLQLVHDGNGLNLSGALRIDAADIDLDKLPGAGATKASPDVVVVDGPPAPASRALPLTATVQVDLGQHTQLTGLGLDGRLRGVLTLNERPGRAATAEGQLDVSGHYKAYGQTLTIEHGKLLFAGTPLDNPGLALRAVRKLNPNATVDDGQQVGLVIGGTARHPQLTVYSNPPMEQSDALAYLITGKPLSQVSSGEGDMLTGAAQALGSAAGNLLAKRIGSTLGVDDIGVASNAALGGNSAFTVGKYLSPRLYVSYGVGLFEPGEVVTLRYRLSHRWNVEAQSATGFSRASFNYRLER